MQEIAELYLESLRLEKGASPNSVEAYSRDLARFVKHFKSKKPDDLSSLDITDFILKLQQDGLSTGSIARNLSAIKGMFKYAIRTGMFKSNPAASIAGPKIYRTLPETLTIEQIIKILSLPDLSTKLGLRDKALLEFLYGTGARISEALICRSDDLIPEMKLVRLFGKGKKERVVPLGKAGWQAVDNYIGEARPKLVNEKSADYIFLGLRGNPLKRMAGWSIVKKYCTMAGILKNVSPHTFRHSFASHLLAGGADLLAVQELLGHADISTTEIYTHIDSDFVISEHREFHPREKWKN
ncbi:MAG: tyrosine recombinase XerD [candidate division Zixibacteria bacterium]|nr:tyrosine recombinase XerD [candidate division Zixibacteria bacterium]